MSDSILTPAPRVPVAVRPATAADLPFIDALQKRHAKAVGWMPTQQLAGKIAAGQVVVAEEVSSQWSVVSSRGASPTTDYGPLTTDSRIGYAIAADRYLKHDDVGIIYQVNVVPGAQRGLVGAALVRAVFDRAAYGCKLFCCWCAQDLEANRFWESLGFVPLAFRAGSAAKSRVHIFWQRRVRAGDTNTPWWFPSQTSAGAIREDRLVLPIPPGTHWTDAKPILLPGTEVEPPDADRRLPAKAQKKPRPTTAVGALPANPPASRRLGGWGFAPPPPPAKPVEPVPAERKPRPRAKNDPALVAKARELRDRWLERVNAGALLAAPAPKHDVGRTIAEADEPIGIGQSAVVGAVGRAARALPAPVAA